MSSETEIVPVAIVEDSLDEGIRVGHEEFTDLYGVTPTFNSIKFCDLPLTYERLTSGTYAAILVSRSLIGSLPLDNLVLDTVSEATRCVNMISSNEGVHYGTNTDFVGIHYALTSAVPDPQNRDVMLLGSGPWMKIAAYVLVKFFNTRFLYVPFSKNFESIKQYVLSLDCTCRVFNLSHFHRASLPVSISCVVTDIPLVEQIDANHPFKNMLSAVFDSLDRGSCPSYRGIFLNLGTRHGDDAGWSRMLNNRLGWTTVKLPTLHLVTVPVTWKVLDVVCAVMDLTNQLPFLTSVSFARSRAHSCAVNDLHGDTWVEPHSSHTFRPGISGRRIYCERTGPGMAVLPHPFSFIFSTSLLGERTLPKTGHVLVAKHGLSHTHPLQVVDVCADDLSTISVLLLVLVAIPDWAFSLVATEHPNINDRRFLQAVPGTVTINRRIGVKSVFGEAIPFVEIKSTLRNTGAFIHGSAAQSIFPKEIFIATPVTTRRDWLRLLERIPDTMSYHFENFVTCVDGDPVERVRSTIFLPTGVIVTVQESSQASAFPLLLTQPMTSLACGVSYSSVFSLYPELCFRRVTHPVFTCAGGPDDDRRILPNDPPEQARKGRSGFDCHISHVKDVEAVEAVTTPKNSAPLKSRFVDELAKTAPKRVKDNAYPVEGISTKRVSDVAVQTDATTFPIDSSSVPYERLSTRFAKVRSRCNELHVSLDHARLASEVGWSKYWSADADRRKLTKLLGESNKDLMDARKVIEECSKELHDVREELDELICVKESAVSDLRFWKRKLADMGGLPDITDHYDDYCDS
ncbi:hypothetical protein K435DRAFT_810738 [Dendrothele bispora CBS 962.96]|uniref:Uncharacterized protein n=1 Tax=Dendrothele bispora (strain CBS 962.96) TaxID=1314807 RepID=A0A4S8KU59_DENBC|nr:hypothetical protein K435DRAFT_810738 [Dendrothele bispora CBS 962.96]